MAFDRRVSADTTHDHGLCLNQFQALPPGNPEANFQNLSIPSHLSKFFCQMPGPQVSLRPFNLINFTLFHHFQDLNH